MRIGRRIEKLRDQRHDRAFALGERLADDTRRLGSAGKCHDIDAERARLHRIGPPVDRGDRQALAGQRLERGRGAWRHGEHGIAGGQRLHRLRQQRVGIRAEAKRPPARHQRQRVRLACRPGQVDRTEIGGGGGGNRRRALAAQVLAQDGDAVEPGRPAAKRRVWQIVGELGRCDLVAFR